MPSSLTMSLSTPWYALPGHVCPFAVRVPVRLSLAGFLGSWITRTLGPPRMERRTLRFGSGRVLDCAPRRLHPSTRSSVCARRCHFSVAASPARAVTEYQPCLPSPSPFGLGLGPDLPRDDWHRPGNLGLAAGGFAPPLSLLIPTFAFPGAPAWVAPCILRTWNAPLPIRSFDIPRLRHLPYTRLLSTRAPSTSELLRTL